MLDISVNTIEKLSCISCNYKYVWVVGIPGGPDVVNDRCNHYFIRRNNKSSKIQTLNRLLVKTVVLHTFIMLK